MNLLHPFNSDRRTRKSRAMKPAVSGLETRELFATGGSIFAVSTGKSGTATVQVGEDKPQVTTTTSLIVKTGSSTAIKGGSTFAQSDTTVKSTG